MINLNNFVLSTQRQSSHQQQQQQQQQMHRPVPTMVAQPQHAPTPPLFIVIQSPQQQQQPTTTQFCHSMGTPTATTTAAPMMFLQPAPASTQSSLQVSPSLSPHPLQHQHHHHHPHHLPFGQHSSIFGTPTQNRSMPTTPTTAVSMPTQGLTGMCATHGKLRALSALRPHPMKPGKFVCVESNVCVRLQTRVTTGASTLPTLPVNPTNNNNNSNATPPYANPAVMKNRRFSESDKKDIVGAVSYLTLRSEEEKKKTTKNDEDDDDDDPTAILKDFVLAMGRRHSADPSSTPEGDTLDLADDVFSKFEREYRSTTTSGDDGAVTPGSRKMSTQDPGGLGDTFNGGLKCPPPIDL